MTDTSKPLFSFGIVADPQYADIPARPEMGRYYGASLAKLDAAIDVFNSEDLAFVITLGDLIDRGWTEFDTILSRYARLRHRAVHLSGNHDFAVEPQHLPNVHTRLGMPHPWHDFAHANVRFLVLDGSDVSTFAPPIDDPRRALALERLTALERTDAINAKDWNGSLGERQFAWLEAKLSEADAAGAPVVLFCHYPIFPENAHNLWDAPDLIALLSRHESAKAWLCGHNHMGNYGVIGHTHVVTFKGMVDTPDANTFAIADVYDDRIAIRGFGREESRILAF